MSKQTEKQRAKRKQIIDAAISCFIEKGFHATSTAEICKAAGMSPGNLFHYYPTKNAIIEAIAEEDSHDYNEILHTNDDESSVMATIEKMMTSLIHLYNQPDYARLSIEIIAEASRNPTINKIFIENEKKIRERLALLIRKGIETGEIDKQINAEQTASWLMITAGGAIGRELVEPNFKWLESMGSFTYMIRKIFAS